MRSSKRFKHVPGLIKNNKPSHRSWLCMRDRCLNPNSNKYATYGAMGIKVCPEWDDFGRFLKDMGPRPPGTTIDRKDNKLGYEPGNCRWATAWQQRLNQRRVSPTLAQNFVHRKRMETGLLGTEFALKFGIPSRTLYQIENGVQPQNKTLLILARALNCKPSEILDALIPQFRNPQRVFNRTSTTTRTLLKETEIETRSCPRMVCCWEKTRKHPRGITWISDWKQGHWEPCPFCKKHSYRQGVYLWVWKLLTPLPSQPLPRPQS